MKKETSCELHKYMYILFRTNIERVRVISLVKERVFFKFEILFPSLRVGISSWRCFRKENKMKTSWYLCLIQALWDEYIRIQVSICSCVRTLITWPCPTVLAEGMPSRIFLADLQVFLCFQDINVSIQI